MKKQTLTGLGILALLIVALFGFGPGNQWLSSLQNIGFKADQKATFTQGQGNGLSTKTAGVDPTDTNAAGDPNSTSNSATGGTTSTGNADPDSASDPGGTGTSGADNPSSPPVDPSGVVISSSPKSGYIELSFKSKKSKPQQPFLTLVDFVFTDATGKKSVHPAYYAGGSSNSWVVNANLTKGNYSIAINYEGATIGIASGNTLNVSQNFKRNFVYIDPTNNQRFKKGSDYFFPVGFNTQYFLNGLKDNKKPANSYKAVFEKMLPFFNTARFNISRQMNLMEGVAPGDFNETAINYVDKVFKLSEQTGVNLYVLLDHRTGNQELPIKYLPFEISASAFKKQWAASSWNKKNGGVLNHPRELTTNAEAMRIFKARDRYFIARWGWSPEFIVMELCAEAYLWHHAHPTEDLNAFRLWQKERYDYLKAIDPYGRLITTGDGMKKYGGKAPTRIGGNGWEWMDFYNAHIHPKVGRKAKFTSLADPKNGPYTHAYAMGNHFEHGQTAHYNLSKKTVWSSAMGYGPTVETFTDKPGEEFLRTRTLWDRHIYWESLFSAVAGIGMAWDVHGAYVKYDAVSLYKGMVKFAQNAGIPQESFVAIPQSTRGNSPLQVSGAKLWAHGMKNSRKTLVHLFHVDDTFKLQNESGQNRNASVQVPVDFSGTAKIEFYNTRSGDKESEISAPVSGGKVTVDCPDFRRDLAIVLTSN